MNIQSNLRTKLTQTVDSEDRFSMYVVKQCRKFETKASCECHSTFGRAFESKSNRIHSVFQYFNTDVIFIYNNDSKEIWNDFKSPKNNILRNTRIIDTYKCHFVIHIRPFEVTHRHWHTSYISTWDQDVGLLKKSLIKFRCLNLPPIALLLCWTSYKPKI